MEVPKGKCIEWQGSFTSSGYPKVYWRGCDVLVTRLVYYLETGEQPEVVRHRCHNPKCFRTSHLIGGTHQDNATDRVQAGRSAIGMRNGNSKLSDTMVSLILHSPTSGRKLARKIGIDATHISRIRRGLYWRDLSRVGDKQ